MKHGYLKTGVLILCCLFYGNGVEAKNGKIRVRKAADAGGLLAELRKAQYSAPPVHAGKMISHDIGNVVIDPAGDDWPDALVENLVPDQAGDGSLSWPFSLYEDAFSHDSLLLNRDGNVIHVFAADAGYDPEWVAHRRFYSNKEDIADVSSSMIRFEDFLSPCRVGLKGRFVLADHPSVTSETKRVLKQAQQSQWQVASPAVSEKAANGALSFMADSRIMSASLLSNDPHGISGENPGFPPEGYRDYLYVQVGHEPPRLLNSPKNVRSVARAASCTLVVFNDGTVTGIGYDPRYYDPSGEPLSPPVVTWFDVPPNITNVVSAVADWSNYFLFLRGDGRVVGWGQTNNACGRGNVPPAVTNAVALAQGYGHAAAMLKTGAVVAWGDNWCGQTNVPSCVMTNAISVVAGGDFTMALLRNRRVVAWGSSGYGQTNVPARVTNAVAVAAGCSHGLALLADGTVAAWGDNGCGQTNVPSNVTNAVAIAAGSDHCAALLGDGTVVVWGDDSYGQTDVPDCVTEALGLCAADTLNGALLSDGSAAVWGGWSEDGCPEEPLTTLGQMLTCRVLQTAFSDGCEPGVLTAVVRAPEDSLDGDADGDGLSLFDELFSYSTNPDNPDSDGDGLDDGAETAVPFLTLWDPADPVGRAFFGYDAVQVTATDTARAARLADGRVIVFTDSGSGLKVYTNECDSVEIDATDAWVAARLADGNVKVWREVSGGLFEYSLGFTNAVEISGGFQHVLVRFANGTVTCLRVGSSGAPEAYSSSFCSGISGAVKVSAGSSADAVLRSDGSFRFGIATGSYFTDKTFTGTPTPVPVDVVAGTNKNYAVLFSSGLAAAYQHTTTTYYTPTGAVAIAAGGDQLLAVLSDGRNAVFTSGGTSWSYTSVTNRLLGARDLWWRRNSRMAVTDAGGLVVMQNSVNSGMRLEFASAAVTPGGLARGIALACSGTCPTNSDTDADNMPDGWEVGYGFNPLDASNQYVDSDNDGLTNCSEYVYNTNPFLWDTDGDGYSDGWEVGTGIFDPTDPTDTGADPDGDGLTNVEEYLLGTRPDLYDTDGDGLSDGAETTVPFLTLWDSAGDTGQVFTACMVAQVTASDTTRAALLRDGKVIVFTGSGSGLAAYTNDCGAVEIDATESWIAARVADGGVRVWRVATNGVLVTANPGLTNVVGLSGGGGHLLTLHADGSVTCLKADQSGSPMVLTNTFCTTASTNVVAFAAGISGDAAVLKGSKFLFGDVFSATAPSQVAFSGECVDIAAGSNRVFLAQFSTGTSIALRYNGSSYSTYTGPSGTRFIAAGGSRDMVAVLSNGSNSVFSGTTLSWSYTAVTNRLTDSRDLWWRRDCRLAVKVDGTLLPLSAASSSGRALDYFAAAVTPRGLARGIAAACSGTCPTNGDTDVDELLDGWEVENGFNPRDASDARRDTDSDGMLDWWEKMHGFNMWNGSDAAADTDGDGVSNLREFVRGTDPRDSASVNRTLYVDSVIGSNTFDGCWSYVRTYGRGPKAGVQQMLNDAVSGDVIEMRGSAAFTDRTLTTGGKGITLRPIGSIRF